MRYLVLLLALLSPVPVCAEVDISDARIKHLPPSVPVRAGYMTLHNRGDSTLVITGFSSDAFASIEIHRSEMHEGMMRMTPVDNLELTPGERIELAPGGLHLMMMQPAESMKPGDEIDTIMRLDDGSETGFTMKVIP